MKLVPTALAILVTTFVAGAALAETPKAAIGTGNFRRAEVLQAAGARSASATVTGVYGSKVAKTVRVEAVEVTRGANAGKVTLVRTPTNKNIPVSRLTKAQANRMGFLTQTDAEKLAERNGGVAGSPTKVTVKATGLAASGESYNFHQTQPNGVKLAPQKSWDGTKMITYKVVNIDRTVGIVGGAESATFAYKNVRTSK